MATVSIPASFPDPDNYSSVRAWAKALIDVLNEISENRPQPLYCASYLGNEKAFAEGVILYDRTGDTLVVSNGQEYVSLLNENSFLDLRTYPYTAINRDVDTSVLEVNSGTGASKGARITMNGPNWPVTPYEMTLRASSFNFTNADGSTDPVINFDGYVIADKGFFSTNRVEGYRGFATYSQLLADNSASKVSTSIGFAVACTLVINTSLNGAGAIVYLAGNLSNSSGAGVWSVVNQNTINLGLSQGQVLSGTTGSDGLLNLSFFRNPDDTIDLYVENRLGSNRFVAITILGRWG